MLLPSAQARIVYTPAHVRIGEMHALDLNHDGKTDFFLYDTFFHGTTHSVTYSGSDLAVVGVERNGVVGNRSTHYLAKPLRAGAKIGTKNDFYGERMALNQHTSHGGHETTSGFWLNGGKGVKNRYLGLRFTINDKTHYGWARLNVSFSSHIITGTLTGYAYETVPNKPIIAGKTKGPDVVTLQPATLGHLAQGAPAIANGRAKRTAVTH